MEQSKARARAAGRTFRESLDLTALEELSEKACANCYEFLQQQGIQTISIYESFGSELKTTSLISQLNGAELHVQSKEPVFPDAQFDAVVVPLLAADSKGNRVGYGKGHYDRFLESQENALVIGLCFEGQLLDAVESEAHDVVLGVIVTEERVIRTT